MSDDSPEAKMQRSGAFWMAFIGLALLGAIVLVVAVPGIERELTHRSALALKKFDWLGIEVDGRTLVLTGTAPDNASLVDVQRAARKITPVLLIDDRISVSPTNPLELARALEQETAVESDATPVDGTIVAANPAFENTQADQLNVPSGNDSQAESTSVPLMPEQSSPTVESEVTATQSEPVVLPPLDPSPAQVPALTKPQVSTNECQAKLDAAMRSEIIRFQSGSVEIIPASHSLLIDVSRVALNCRSRIEVSGHTDDLGEEAENISLSLRRAEAVTEFLVSQGVQADMLVANGYGEAFPVQANTTWAGRKANRRIAFKALPEGGQVSESVGQESP